MYKTYMQIENGKEDNSIIATKGIPRGKLNQNVKEGTDYSAPNIHGKRQMHLLVKPT